MGKECLRKFEAAMMAMPHQMSQELRPITDATLFLRKAPERSKMHRMKRPLAKGNGPTSTTKAASLPVPLAPSMPLELIDSCLESHSKPRLCLGCSALLEI